MSLLLQASALLSEFMAADKMEMADVMGSGGTSVDNSKKRGTPGQGGAGQARSAWPRRLGRAGQETLTSWAGLRAWR